MRRSRRGAAVALAATWLVAAGALQSAAQATTVHTTLEEIDVHLSGPEAQVARGTVIGAFTLCWADVLPQVQTYLTIPLSVDRCTYGLNECSRSAQEAEWESFSILFTRDLVLCPHVD
jgi:hypothetical protein